MTSGWCRGRRPAWLLAACATAAWLSAAGAASAACTVSVASNVAFGTYNVFSTAPLDSVGQLRWRCDIFTFPNVRVTLSRGGHPTFFPRRMGPATAGLDDLDLDAARTRIGATRARARRPTTSNTGGSGGSR